MEREQAYSVNKEKKVFYTNTVYVEKKTTTEKINNSKSHQTMESKDIE